MRKIINFIISFLLVFNIFSPGLNTALADVNKGVYTNVLDDLEHDNSFKKEDYPLNEEDYSLQIIQVAESVNKELIIYVYQPTGNKGILATYINMSLNSEFNNPALYSLELLNYTGQFFKYKVNSINVSSESVRYYNIASIFRDFISDVDEDVTSDNTINSVSFEVAQLWAFSLDNENNLLVEMQKTEVVTIVDKYVGFLRYTSDKFWTGKKCDVHFVAFSTDHKIDNLYEADIRYVTKKYKTTTDLGILLEGVESGTKYESAITHDDTLTSSGSIDVTLGAILKFKHSWDMISSSNKFIDDHEKENIKFTSSAKAQIENKKWVLTFTTSDYKISYDSVAGTKVVSYETGTKVEQVTILRLKFKSDGKIYNLGVVDNMQTGSDTPSGIFYSFFDRLLDLIKKILDFLRNNWWWILLCVIGIIILIPLLPTIIAIIIPLIFKGIKLLFKGLWWLLSTPFEIFKDE